ncbi:hypothetical protein AVDCRST_MAG81-5060 [uncultured Synechococcales cyanobacterium]|uniref:Antitoxin Xre/MbcA/ParS-like toxin-binding domain-containing protein n=1 Tax=uncultured Synechococcales cyanobacterium TaxID=1936017 RepID=A0A6J4VWA7_9CYAN|nr:hypothetical protein AVDCRST_MAG81-5060 [uncultured Synechococcales cyanobacterium]
MLKATKQGRQAQKQTVVKQKVSTGNTQTAYRYEVVKDISNRYSLGKAGVKQLFGISEATQFRYEKQNSTLKPAISDRVERFNRIVNQAKELFEDEVETQRWLSTPKDALEGATPLKALATDAGAKKVEEILYRAEYGMYG